MFSNIARNHCGTQFLRRKGVFFVPTIESVDDTKNNNGVKTNALQREQKKKSSLN